MQKGKVYWEGIIHAVNALMSILKHKPREFKDCVTLHPGGILNAYREGDLTFNQAVRELERWKKRPTSAPASPHRAFINE
jgi:hypothetical protein